MVERVLEYLRPRPGQVMVDATIGGGGHALALLEAMGGKGWVIGIDRDPEALQECRRRFRGRPQVRLIHADYAELDAVLEDQGVDRVDGILMDLGASSRQFEDAARGFSFRREGPLDMRVDRSRGQTAADLLARASRQELERIVRAFGEERYAARIARRLVEERQRRPIDTTRRLADLVWRAVPPAARRGRIHPATRTFQALRIAVNRELDRLGEGLERGIRRLTPGGRMVVLSYHSLEDRIVKQTFQRYLGKCTCPPEFPECRCRPQRLLQVLTPRPLRPDAREREENPRARSARLRAAERLPDRSDA